MSNSSVRLSRLSRMLEQYRNAGDDVPAWLSAMGQMDVEKAIKMEMKDRYAQFLRKKQAVHAPGGFDVAMVSGNLYPFQSHIVRWALRLGKAAIFADCGLGKTLMQLEWAKHVCDRTGGAVLILAPLAVATQTHREGSKFGIPVNVCRTQADVNPGVNISNYEMMHHFTMGVFQGIVLDESSILKSYSGATRNAIINATAGVPYRLACTATPSPNDYMELGNHSEFLGVQTRTGMLATYFNHDGGETSKWRLKGHAEKPFWRWMASWAVMISRPSDLGYEDSGYSLPPIHRYFHEIETEAQSGVLFAVEADSLSERRESRKISIEKRVERLSGIVNHDRDQWLVWGDLNAETDAAEEAIADAIQVQGSDSPEYKESAMLGFADGKHRVLVTKPKIGGFGMNWQNCNKMAFMGLSDSYEATYQAERRCWRYGQQRPVEVHTFVTDRDAAVVRNIERKRKQAEEMTQAMVEAMKETHD